MRPPKEIDGARVIEWAWSHPEPFFVVPYSDRSGGIPIHGLAICRYEDSGAIYRFSCNENWETENDSPQDSIAAARQRLSEWASRTGCRPMEHRP